MAYARLKLKELGSSRNGSSCAFCKQTKNDVLSYGKIYQFGDIITHYFCMLFSSQMEQNGKDEDGILGFLPNDIKKELVRGRKLSCVFCHQNGATINCSSRTCKKRYHFPCAVDNGALHEFFNQYRSFCLQHRRFQRTYINGAKNVEKVTCLMCQEDVKCRPSLETIWAPCCKTAWFHRTCVQKMALSAGYFFKCPKCNNKDTFRKEMLECGIYIPDQDASWELEENAFRELSERHNQCDVENCVCPQGRAHSTTDGDWEITLCSLCGHQGVHTLCGEQKLNSRGQWTCEFCASVISKMQPTAPMPGSSLNTLNRGLRHRRGRRRKRAASEVGEPPAPKTAIVTQELTSESTTCLYDNGGQAIHVVKVDNIETSGDKVVEIGGVNVVNTEDAGAASDVIALGSSDEDEKRGIATPPTTSRISSSQTQQSSLPTTRRNPPSSTEPPSLVIDLLDSDDESPTHSRLSPILVDDDDDDDDDEDVVFMGCHEAATSFNEKVQTPAMIRIVRNNNVVVLSASELIRQDVLKRTASAGSPMDMVTPNNHRTSNTMWQSVPRHKSMVHSVPQSLTQVSNHDRNINHTNETNRTTTRPQIKEQRWIPRLLQNGATPSVHGLGSVTNNYGVNEVIDLD